MFIYNNKQIDLTHPIFTTVVYGDDGFERHDLTEKEKSEALKLRITKLIKEGTILEIETAPKPKEKNSK